MDSTEKQLQVAVITDAHLPVESGHPDMAQFLIMLEAVSAVSTHVILLGDLFRVWAVVPPFDHENGRLLLEAVQRIGRDRFSFVEGNWDFYVDRAFPDSFARISRHGLELRLDNHTFRFVHGHLHTGWKDRLWMGLLKSGIAYRLFKTGWFRGLLFRLNRSFQTGMYSEILDDHRLAELCTTLEAHFPSADRIICGHAHRMFSGGKVTILPDYHSTGLVWGYDDRDRYFRYAGDRMAEVPSNHRDDAVETLVLD